MSIQRLIEEHNSMTKLHREQIQGLEKAFKKSFGKASGASFSSSAVLDGLPLSTKIKIQFYRRMDKSKQAPKKKKTREKSPEDQ